MSQAPTSAHKGLGAHNNKKWGVRTASGGIALQAEDVARAVVLRAQGRKSRTSVAIMDGLLLHSQGSSKKTMAMGKEKGRCMYIAGKVGGHAGDAQAVVGGRDGPVLEEACQVAGWVLCRRYDILATFAHTSITLPSFKSQRHPPPLKAPITSPEVGLLGRSAAQRDTARSSKRVLTHHARTMLLTVLKRGFFMTKVCGLITNKVFHNKKTRVKGEVDDGRI